MHSVCSYLNRGYNTASNYFLKNDGVTGSCARSAKAALMTLRNFGSTFTHAAEQEYAFYLRAPATFMIYGGMGIFLYFFSYVCPPTESSEEENFIFIKFGRRYHN